MHQALSIGYAFALGAALSFACYSLLAMLFAWWVAALLAMFIVQPALVYGFEALCPGAIDRGCTAAASFTITGIQAVRGLFTKSITA